MRIEDDILLGSDDAVEVLTKDAVRDPEGIKVLMINGCDEQNNGDLRILQNVPR